MNVLALSDLHSHVACCQAIEAGKVVVVPTSRWYMFAGSADDPAIADWIFQFKRRPPDKSLLLVAPSTQWVASSFVLTTQAEQLANAFWPGELSMRLRWDESVSAIESVGAPIGLVTVAPGLLGDLAATLGRPLVSTSVNFSGSPASGGTQPSFAIDQALRTLRAAESDSAVAVAVVVDGGVCPLVEATTVVDCSTPDRTWLERPGAVHADALAHVWADIDLTRARRDTAGFQP